MSVILNFMKVSFKPQLYDKLLLELQALMFMLRHMQTLVLCKQTCIFLQLFPCLHHFFHEDLIVPPRCTLRDNSLHVVTLTNTFISILVLQVKSFTSNFNELTLHSTIY